MGGKIPKGQDIHTTKTRKLRPKDKTKAPGKKKPEPAKKIRKSPTMEVNQADIDFEQDEEQANSNQSWYGSESEDNESRE